MLTRKPLAKSVGNFSEDSSWKSFYIFENELVGSGSAGKVYKIKPKWNEISCRFSKDMNHTNCNENSCSKYYACKSIKIWRRGVDTTEKIKHELRVLCRMQSNMDKTAFLYMSKESSIVKDIMHELQCASSLPTPPKSASPKLISFHEDKERGFIVMEYANGGSLCDLCEEFYGDSFTFCSTPGRCPAERLPESYVVEVIHKLLLAISYMHKHLRIVHLDIKAQNVLLREPYPSNDIFLTDFGLATELTDKKPHRLMVGTPDYIAPEVLNYEPISFATDMWSLGVLTYYLLTGVSPFMANEKQFTLQNVTHGPIEFPEKLFFDRSPEAVQFVKALLIRKQSSRLTAEQCLQHQWLQLVGQSTWNQVDRHSYHVDGLRTTINELESSTNPFPTSTCVVPLQHVDTVDSNSIVVPLLPSSEPKSIRPELYGLDKGYFANITVHLRKMKVFSNDKSLQLISLTSLEIDLIWVKPLRNLRLQNGLNPIMLHLPSSSWSHVHVPGSDSCKTNHLNKSLLCGTESNQGLEKLPSANMSVEPRARTRCVKIHVDIPCPNVHHLTVEKEYSCSALIYVSGSTSFIFNRERYAIFPGLNAGADHSRNKLGLITNIPICTSLIRLHLASPTSSLFTTRTSIRSLQPQLKRKQMNWVITTPRRLPANETVQINSLSIAHSHDRCTNLTSEANFSFCHQVRSIYNLFRRVVQYISSSFDNSLFRINKSERNST